MSVHFRCPTFLALTLAMMLPWTASAGDLPVSVRPGAIYPGDVVRVTVTAPPGVSAVVATWQEREIPFTGQGNGSWDALIGVDIADQPGPRSLLINARQGDGAALTTTFEFRVEARTLRTRRITVNPKFVTPPTSALPRIKEENELLNALFRQTSPQRHWTANAVRPVEGVAVSGFGVRTIMNGQPGGPHNGLDLAAVTGTPIYAPAPGVVVYARDFYYSGNTVILDHGQGLYSTMAHLSVIDVHEGDPVDQGVLLGKVGATGRVTGPHLHWGVRLHGARVDPLSLVDTLAARLPTP